MKRILLLAALAAGLVALPARAQETPHQLVVTYDHLADSILGLNDAEDSLVRSVLYVHYHAAENAMQAKNYEAAAAQMALFGTEGDNAMEGVRKRLLEGGHHHHATAEEEAKFDPGYVIVTRKAKQQILAASKSLRQARDESARTSAWNQFEAAAKPLLEK